MTLDDFWSIIDASTKIGGGGDDRQREALRDLLLKRRDSDLVDFSKHFQALMVRAFHDAEIKRRYPRIWAHLRAALSTRHGS